jgi:hypothetical protein
VIFRSSVLVFGKRFVKRFPQGTFPVWFHTVNNLGKYQVFPGVLQWALRLWNSLGQKFLLISRHRGNDLARFCFRNTLPSRSTTPPRREEHLGSFRVNALRCGIAWVRSSGRSFLVLERSPQSAGEHLPILTNIAPLFTVALRSPSRSDLRELSDWRTSSRELQQCESEGQVA